MIEEFNRALATIEERLAEDGPGEVDVDDLARVALTSTYHFRRLFSSLAGMGLSTYVRRRRMTLAAAEVQAGTPLLEVAVRHGYGSTEAFGRAFAAVHGVTPAEARAGGVELTSQPRLSFRLTVEGGSCMRHRIVDKPAFTIAGKHTTITLQYDGVSQPAVDFIGSLDPAIHDRLKALSDQDPGGILAVTRSESPDQEEGTPVDYWHGVATSQSVPDDLDVLEVAAGSWVVFNVSGPYPQALQQLWADTATQWFPSNPYRLVPGPALLRTQPRIAPGAHQAGQDWTEADCELWMPVERA
ncbi:MAG TPA: helix-turn-helix domain-containing protein [Egicoccus sp.]|nr:helix-turn-helix domain-containing protein [Egicoccus sp.]HSK23886.1 helix-turn-helix domain-containing protein [Egicoccus sp.]